MTIIEGISDQPQQQITVPLLGGTSFLLTLSYSLQQGCWFYSINWNGNVVCNGQRLVTSPNVLRQYINTIPFGIACLTNGNIEPTGIEDLSDGTAQLILLQGADISLVEQTAFGSPAQPLQATATTSSGQQVIIPPSQWGPATGDLSGSYPGPRVVAIHEGGGQQLTIAPVADGQFLKRVGSSIIGSAGGSGAGNVTGPAGAVSGNLSAFADATGLVIKDAGISPASITAAIAACLASAEGFATTADATVLSTAETFATAAATAAQAAAIAACFPRTGAVGGDLTGNMPNPTVAQLSGVGSITEKPIGYATGGTIQLRFDLGAYDHIGITTAGTTSFSPSGSSGMANGRRQMLDITNTTGSSIVLAWNPAWGLANGALPTSLAPGAWIRVMLYCTGATEATIVASYFATAGGGGGGLPAGGAIYTRLAKNSASTNDVGWYSGSVIDASDYLANGSTLQAAFNAACAVNGVLQLPPGITALPAGGLTLPSTFIGGVGIRGCGKNVSILRQSNAGAGLNFVPNAPTCQPGNTFVHCADFTVRANNGGCTTGILLDYGTGSVTSQGNAGNCTFKNIAVDIQSGTWGTTLYYFRNVWQSTFECISGANSSTSVGDGIQVISCNNLQFIGVSLLECFRGFYQPKGAGAAGDTEGTHITDLRIVQCQLGIWVQFTAAGNQGIWITNFMVDNGDNVLPSGAYLSVYLEQCQEGALTNGQILQGQGGATGGAHMMEINGGTETMISNVGFRYWSSSAASSSIWLTGGVTNCVISGCNPTGSVLFILADAGTSGTKAINNITGATFTDHGSNALTS